MGYLKCLERRGDIGTDAPGFKESLLRHFDSLPTRYALDVNTESLDVLSHARLLDEARADPSASLSFAVRPVEVVVARRGSLPAIGSPIPIRVEQVGGSRPSP